MTDDAYKQAMNAPIEQTNGGMVDGLHVTMYEPAQPWDWIDRMLTAVMRNCVRVVLFCLAAGLVAGFLSAFFKI